MKHFSTLYDEDLRPWAEMQPRFWRNPRERSRGAGSVLLGCALLGAKRVP
jgi:hypothetical protein